MMPELTKTKAYRRSLLGLVAFTLVGLTAVHGDLLGQTLTSVLLPTTEAPAPDTTVVVAPTSTSGLYAAGTVSVERMAPLPVERLAIEIDDETLWLARCIFSETKRPEEQELVAWVIRNRVETSYRDRASYRDVVLDPMQFSAFNPGTRTRGYYSGLTPASQVPGWRTALTIAHEVRHADASYRPFAPTTRHFYSEQAMVGRSHPAWAVGLTPVSPERDHEIEARRFRFFAGIS